MKTRVRAKGSDHDRVTGSMVWADFLHFTARPVDGVPDPHLHMHCYAFNVTYDEVEKRYKAGQFGDLKRDGVYWEAAFDARLATCCFFAVIKRPRLCGTCYEWLKAVASIAIAGYHQHEK